MSMSSEFADAIDDATRKFFGALRPDATPEDEAALTKALLTAVRIRAGRDYGDFVRREDGVAVQAAVLARARDLFNDRFDRRGRLPQELRDAVIAEFTAALDEGFDAFMKQFAEGAP